MTDYNQIFENYNTGCAGRQNRIKGRLLVVPNFSFHNYMVSAKIDKLVIMVSLKAGVSGAGGTNFLAVQKTLLSALGKKLYVKPTIFDNDEKRSWLQFNITFQDPVMEEIDVALKALDDDFGVDCSPTLVEMEVAVDMRPRPNKRTKKHRIEAFKLLRHHFYPSERFGKLNPRSCTGKAKKDTVPLIKWMNAGIIYEPIEIGTIYFGDKVNPVCWKIYHKEFDEVLNAYDKLVLKELADDNKCARIEATLNSEGIQKELNIKSIDDLRNKRLKNLKHLFKFKVPTTIDWKSSVGVMKSSNQWRAYNRVVRPYKSGGIVRLNEISKYNGTDSHENHFMSYKKLNSLVSYALKDIDRKFFNHSYRESS